MVHEMAAPWSWYRPASNTGSTQLHRALYAVTSRRYVINLDGTTGSSRLFKILPTGSLVLKQESRWQQWCAACAEACCACCAKTNGS